MDAEAVKTYPVAVEWETFGVAETPAEYVFHRPRLYLETTIPSYLTARPSRDLNTARMQRITARWWNSWHTQFEICVSDRVIDEVELELRAPVERAYGTETGSDLPIRRLFMPDLMHPGATVGEI